MASVNHFWISKLCKYLTLATFMRNDYSLNQGRISKIIYNNNNIVVYIFLRHYLANCCKFPSF